MGLVFIRPLVVSLLEVAHGFGGFGYTLMRRLDREGQACPAHGGRPTRDLTNQGPGYSKLLHLYIGYKMK